MSHFPLDSQIHNNLYSAKTVRAIDQAAIKHLKNGAIKLMNRAGTAAFEELIEAGKVASLGQITDAMFQVGGAYRRNM